MIGANFLRALAGREPPRAKTMEVVPRVGEISGNDSGFLGRWMPTRWNPDELITRRGMRWYDKIRRDDAVKGAMTLKKGAVLSPGWELTPAPEDPGGEEVVEFIEYVLDHMEPLYGNLDDHLLQILTALDYGFSITEIVWRTIEEPPYNGWWGLRTLKPRKPHRFWFDVDPHDNLLADGIRQDENKYPVEKFLHWGYRREFGNWYGQSDLRETYEWWWLKDNLIKWSAIYAERFAIPIATGTYPQGHPVAADIIAFRTMLENIQANTSMTMSDVFKVELKEAVGRGADVLERLVKAADTGIARAILMPSQLGVTAQPDVGTYAQARKHFDVLLIVVQDIQNDIARQVVRQQLIRRLVFANYGERPLPLFEFKPLQEEDENRLFTMWLAAVTAGVVDTTPQDEIHIREMTDFPERTEEEIQAERDRLEEEAAAAMEAQRQIAEQDKEPPKGPGEEEEDEDDDEDQGRGNGKAKVKAAGWAPPPHGRFVRRVRSRGYDFNPDQPRDPDTGEWTDAGGGGGGAGAKGEKAGEEGDTGGKAPAIQRTPGARLKVGKALSTPGIRDRLSHGKSEKVKTLGGGVSESSVVYLEGDTKAVFKPQEGEPPRIRAQIPDGTAYRREAAASAVAEIGGMTDMVPATVIRKIEGKKGSVQLFVPGAKTGKHYFATGERSKAFDGLNDLARAAVYDHLIGNTDRHYGNWLIRGNGKMALIDNGLSFPVQKGGWGNRQLLAEANARYGALESGGWSKAPEVVKARKAWVGKWPQIERAMKRHKMEPQAIKLAKARWKEITAGLPT
jgi:phage gp29-like protein